MTNAEEDIKSSVKIIIEEISLINTGKSSLRILENINIDVYDNPKTKIKEIAYITLKDINTIIITPWDKNKNVIHAIIKGITKSNIGLNPVQSDNVILCAMPQLTQENRELLIKLAKKTLESGKIKIRLTRNNFKNKLKKNQELSEDELKTMENTLNKLINNGIKKIEEFFLKKTQELKR